MNFEAILFDKTPEGIIKVTLNRPERLNAISGRLADEVTTVIDQTNADPEARVLVLTGAGRAFCAGADMGVMLGGMQSAQQQNAWGTDQNRMALRQGFQRITRGLWNSNVPTIASVNGVAVGGGFDIVCAATWWSPLKPPASWSPTRAGRCFLIWAGSGSSPGFWASAKRRN